MCGLPAHPKHEGLCLSHAQRRAPQPREDDLSHLLASPDGDFMLQIDINHVLGKLFDALAANRISARRAGTLAYIANLLAQTQEGGKNEARRWEIDKPTYLKMLELKYPEDSPVEAIMKAEPAPRQPATDSLRLNPFRQTTLSPPSTRRKPSRLLPFRNHRLPRHWNRLASRLRNPPPTLRSTAIFRTPPIFPRNSPLPPSITSPR
jgi:hypothetical protein